MSNRFWTIDSKRQRLSEFYNDRETSKPLFDTLLERYREHVDYQGYQTSPSSTESAIFWATLAEMGKKSYKLTNQKLSQMMPPNLIERESLFPQNLHFTMMPQHYGYARVMDIATQAPNYRPTMYQQRGPIPKIKRRIH